jgi:putative Holliday junction resolvase
VRVLALDIGERRVGVAVSDPSGRVATPAKVLDASELSDHRALRRLMEDYEPQLVLVGLPLSLDGTEGPQARRVRAQAEKLAAELGVPLDFVDERLSSQQAARAMLEAGVSKREQRGKLDAVAASLFLQAWLDAHKEETDDDGSAQA